MTSIQIEELKEELNELESYKILLDSLFPLTDYNDHAEQELKYCEARKQFIENQIRESE